MPGRRPKKTYREEWDYKGHKLSDPSDWMCMYCNFRFGANQLLTEDIPWCSSTFQGKIEMAVLRAAVQKGLRGVKVSHMTRVELNKQNKLKNLFTTR